MTTDTQEINRGYLNHIRAWSSGGTFSGRLAGTAGRTFLRILAAPAAFAWAALLLLCLKILEAVRGTGTSDVHRRALDCVDLFVRQYPMHFYPIVAKSLELAYLREVIGRADAKSIAEIAIGEGTLSARLFDSSRKIVGVDLNPYSLKKAAGLPHVRKAVVGDGLNPPLTHGAFDLLISNNFLHHVSEKARTIRNWSGVASQVLFNDNSPYWSRSFSGPFLRRVAGMKGASEREARRIEQQLMQHLESREAVRKYAEESCDILEETSFMASRTFALCATFSTMIGSYGPPTPFIMKRIYNTVLSPLAIPLTRALAKALIRFDARQDRATDTYLTLLCRSRSFAKSPAAELRCPACDGPIAETACAQCGRVYQEKDGMLFLLPPELSNIFTEYHPEATTALPAEHL